MGFFSPPQNAAALKDRQRNAGFSFMNAYLLIPVYIDLMRTQKGKLHFFGPDEVTIKKKWKREALNRSRYRARRLHARPEKTYRQLGQKWPLIAICEMRNENACLVVKTLIENHKQIPRPQPIGKESNPQNALKGVGQLKFHTGEFATGAKMAECSLLIKSPINALRSGGGRLLCLFPPSGYSQNRALDMKCCHRRPANKSTRPQPSSGHRWLSNEGK
ncbi:MAG: hypothetical protein VCF07_13945 [Nitrospinota bacterium]